MNTKLPVLRIVFAGFLLMVGCAVSPNDPNQDQTIKVLGMPLVYDDGSWVNPNETKFNFKTPKTWTKRNYGRHYMQGSDEIVNSLVEFDWPKIKETIKTGEVGRGSQSLQIKENLHGSKDPPGSCNISRWHGHWFCFVISSIYCGRGL